MWQCDSLLLFSGWVMSDSFWPHGQQHARLPRFSLSQCLLKLMSIESVMPSNHLVLCYLFLLVPSILPSTRVFSNRSALCTRWPKYWSSASASVLLMNTQGWFPLGLTGLISLQSRGLSQVFSSTTIWKHQFFLALSLPYDPTLTSVHGYWTNRSFDYMDLCWQSDVSAF